MKALFLNRITTASVLFFVVTILFQSIALAQDFKQGVYIEALGNGGAWSMNYERMFEKNFKAKIGAGFISSTLFVPVMGGKSFGKGPHYFEVLAGAVFVRSSTPDDSQRANEIHQNTGGTAFIGYHFSKPQKRLYYRVGYTPFITSSVFHWAGAGMGYKF